jgi:hypothetical protein
MKLLGGEPINEAERLVRSALLHLPDDYSALFDYEYTQVWVDNGDPGLGGELIETGRVDVVVLNPGLGFLVLRIMPGQYGLEQGRWYGLDENDRRELDSDPLCQAQAALSFLLGCWADVTGKSSFPLAASYGVWLPDCSLVPGLGPDAIGQGAILLARDLEDAARRIPEVLGDTTSRYTTSSNTTSWDATSTNATFRNIDSLNTSSWNTAPRDAMARVPGRERAVETLVRDVLLATQRVRRTNLLLW